MRSEKASISSVVVSPLPHSLAMSRNGALLMAAMGARRQSSEISTEPIFMREPGSGPDHQIYTARDRIDLWLGLWQGQRTVSEGGVMSNVRCLDPSALESARKAKARATGAVPASHEGWAALHQHAGPAPVAISLHAHILPSTRSKRASLTV